MAPTAFQALIISGVDVEYLHIEFDDGLHQGLNNFGQAAAPRDPLVNADVGTIMRAGCATLPQAFNPFPCGHLLPGSFLEHEQGRNDPGLAVRTPPPRTAPLNGLTMVRTVEFFRALIPSRRHARLRLGAAAEVGAEEETRANGKAEEGVKASTSAVSRVSP